MPTYRLRISDYDVTDDLAVELAGTVQVLEGESWIDVGDTTVEVPAREFKDCSEIGDYATVVRRHAAQLPLIRKQQVTARLQAVLPSLPANLPLGEL